MLSSEGGYQKTWKGVFQANLDELFQLALLLTADSHVAEANLASVVCTLDLSKQPDENALAVIQTTLARQSIGSGGTTASPRGAGAPSRLPPPFLSFLPFVRFPPF